MKKTKLVPVSKKAKMKMVYGNGGNILNELGQGLNMVAPLTNLIPGIGPMVSTGLGMAGNALQGQSVMGDGGKVEPYYTNDPKDPRIQAYNDSLNAFQTSYNNLLSSKKEINRNINALDYRADKYLSTPEKGALQTYNSTQGRYSYKPQYEERYYKYADLQKVKDKSRTNLMNKINFQNKLNYEDPSYAEAQFNRSMDYDKTNRPIGYYGIGDFKYANNLVVNKKEFNKYAKGVVNKDVEDYYNKNSPYIDIDPILQKRSGIANPKEYDLNRVIPSYAAPKQQVILNKQQPNIQVANNSKPQKLRSSSNLQPKINKQSQVPIQAPAQTPIEPISTQSINDYQGKEDTTKLAFRTDSTGKKYYRVNGKDVPEQIFNSYKQLKHKIVEYGDGGQIGSNIQINAEQNELIIDPKTNKVQMDLRNLPPHPQDPNMINPAGTLNLPEQFKNSIVIPKNGKDGRDAFLEAKEKNNFYALNRIKRNLTNKQATKMAEEQAKGINLYKDGGKLYLKPVKKMEDGGYMGDIYNRAKELANADSAPVDMIPTPPVPTSVTGNTSFNRNPEIRTKPSTPVIAPLKLDQPNPSRNNGLNFLTNNIGNLYQLGNALLDKPTTPRVDNLNQGKSADLMANRRYDAQPELNANNGSYANANYALRNSGTQNGSEMRSRLTDALRSKYMADSRVLANKQNTDNAYKGEEAQFLNQQGEYNRQAQLTANTANEQNDARRQDMVGSSLGSMGRNYNMQNNDNMRLNMLGSLFPGMDPNELLKNIMGGAKTNGQSN